MIRIFFCINHWIVFIQINFPIQYFSNCVNILIVQHCFVSGWLLAGIFYFVLLYIFDDFTIQFIYFRVTILVFWTRFRWCFVGLILVCLNGFYYIFVLFEVDVMHEWGLEDVRIFNTVLFYFWFVINYLFRVFIPYQLRILLTLFFVLCKRIVSYFSSYVIWMGFVKW